MTGHAVPPPLTADACAALRKALEHVLAHPREHEQGTWGARRSSACGTVFCLAGHVAVTVLGATPIWRDSGQLHGVVPAGARPDAVQSVRWYVERELGFDLDVSAYLFGGANTVLDLVEAVRWLTAGRVDLRDALAASTVPTEQRVRRTKFPWEVTTRW